MNVLITSASRKVALVRAFQSALARRGGGNVIAVDASPLAAALYVADRHFLVPLSTEPHFLDQLLQLCLQEQVGLIIPTRDEELPVFADARAHFEQHAVRVMVPAAETVRTCQDKLAFVEFCRAHNFQTPHTYSRGEWRNAEFPLFVRPRFGKGGKGARCVQDETELREAACDADHWLIQELVRCPEYTVDLFADFDGQVLSAVPRLRQLVVAGESYVSRTVTEPLLIAASARLARELHLVGHNTIQCFWDGKQAKFIEVNPRFGGGAALGIAAGADTPAMLLRLLAGEAVPEQLGEFQSDLVMLRFTDDLFLKASAFVPAPEGQSLVADLPLNRDRNAGVRAVLFDLDNTLYPEEQFVVGGFRAVSQLLAMRFDLAAEALFEQMLKIMRSHGRGKVFDLLLRETGIDSVAWLPTLLHVYRSHQPVLSLFPETAASLRALKDRGLRLGIITDGLASVQRRKIAALRLEAYMDAIVCTGELGQGCAKPSTIPFEVALTLLDVAPQTTAYIADDISKDFAGPNQLGMKTVQIRSAGLLGVREKPVPSKAVYQPHLAADSLPEALILLGLL